MADEEHLRILRQGVGVWNRWREGHPDIRPDLSKADLSWKDLSGANLAAAFLLDANLRHTDLSKANLHRAMLFRADLTDAFLIEADLSEADLSGVIFRDAHLYRANLSMALLHFADLNGADLTGADLTQAHLEYSRLNESVLSDADLTGCHVYGVSTWKMRLDGAKQTNLVITPADEPAITVDNLEVAQFIYLLLNNERIRYVIDTITSKVVLILGRFTPERKAILDALRDTLRGCNYTPVVFDFDKPASRDLTETVSTLAHLARFVIADITDPRSIPQELQAIVPGLAVPVQPIIARPQQPWGMFVDLPKKHHWVLAPHEYTDLRDLLPDLQAHVIEPAEAKARQLVGR